MQHNPRGMLPFRPLVGAVVACGATSRKCVIVKMTKRRKRSFLILFVGVLISQFLLKCNGAVDAFCRNDKNSIFPLPVPRDLYLPWIWDAVYVDLAHNNRYVEITAVAPPIHACHFNRSQWTKDTAGGRSNILVDTAASQTLQNQLRHHIAAITTMTDGQKQQAIADVENAHLLVGERLKCEFLDHNDKLLYGAWSDVITGNPMWLGS